MLWVVVLIAQDGTVAVVGTRSGRPFTSYARAQTTAALWDDGSRQVDIVTIDDGENV